jgi:YVTN family beta-propeller protein
VVNSGSANVSVIDTATQQVLDTISVEHRPATVAMASAREVVNTQKVHWVVGLPFLVLYLGWKHYFIHQKFKNPWLA